MANALYNKGRNAFLTGEIDWLSDTIRAALVSTSYSPDLATDEYWIEVSSYVVGSPVILNGKAAVDGIADANPIVYSAVSGSQIGSIVLYKDTGNSTTSRLIAFIDNGVGFPITPNGGNIGITWDTGANKIFRL